MPEKANHSAAQPWWRSVAEGLGVEQAQSGIDKLAVRMDERRRTLDGTKATVGELAAAEPLLEVPALPFPAELVVERTVTAQGLVPFDGNFSSVPPALPGARVLVGIGGRSAGPDGESVRRGLAEGKIRRGSTGCLKRYVAREIYL
ncbi:hypothetical protein [Streptomyces sp. NPDC001604]|uniref:hypothetical protein n=1 Tax=Streptomyces sp. NPDC001604 TaxID=3364593 RepID=UPI0036CC691D